MNILDKLKEIRESKHLSRNEVAKKLAVSASLINEIESGRSRLSLDFFIQLCQLYNTNPLELIKNDTNYYIILNNEDIETLNNTINVLNKIKGQTENIQNNTINDNHGTININQNNTKKEK